MSAPQQLDYSPINNLLNWRDGVLGGLKAEEMAARIYGVTKENIESDLERLKLIDGYLADFLGKPERYYLVRALNEHFIDLQLIMNWAKRPRGVPMNWKPTASDINELKLVGLYYIRGRFPHLRIRELRDLFATQESWNEAKKVLDLNVEAPVEGTGTNEAEAASVTNDDSEEADVSSEDTAFTTTVEEQDIQEEVIWRAANERALKNFYEDAKEQKQIVKDSQRPLALARKALKMLQAIRPQKAKLTEPELDDVLRDVVSTTNALRKIIHQNPRSKDRRK